MKSKKIGIITGLVIGLLLVGGWIIYLVTLPKLETQLKFSPFNVVGTWQCNETDFIITSSQNNNENYEQIAVSCKINYNNKEYNLTLNYVSTRGFNHKYAASITATSNYSGDLENYRINFDGYKFEENKLKLIIYSDNIFNGEFKTLTFNKIN